MSLKVSIIVPIYNISKYLEKCIESVISQTYKNIEILLVNDGSTDNCLEICKKYKKLDKRIKIINKKNGGLSDARNAGLKCASGEYIFFLDGDDFISKDTIEYLVSLLEERNADVCVCNYFLHYPDTRENFIKEKFVEDVVIEYSLESALIDMLDVNKSFGWCAWNKLYKKNILTNFEYPYGKLYEDIGTTYKAICNSKKIVFSSKALYYYVQNPKSITKTFKYNEREKHRIEMGNKMCDDLLKITKNDFLIGRIEKVRCNQYVAVLNVMIRAGEDDAFFIKDVKRIIKEKFIQIKKHLNSKEIKQYYILTKSYYFYKLIFKIINKV